MTPERPDQPLVKANQEVCQTCGHNVDGFCISNSDPEECQQEEDTEAAAELEEASYERFE